MTNWDKALYVIICLSIGWNVHTINKWKDLVSQSYNSGYEHGVKDMAAIVGVN